MACTTVRMSAHGVKKMPMPGEDGLEVARQLRAESAGLPIIILTGVEDGGDRVMGLELGADDYLTKPFSPRTVPSTRRWPGCGRSSTHRRPVPRSSGPSGAGYVFCADVEIVPLTGPIPSSDSRARRRLV